MCDTAGSQTPDSKVCTWGRFAQRKTPDKVSWCSLQVRLGRRDASRWWLYLTLTMLRSMSVPTCRGVLKLRPDSILSICGHKSQTEVEWNKWIINGGLWAPPACRQYPGELVTIFITNILQLYIYFMAYFITQVLQLESSGKGYLLLTDNCTKFPSALCVHNFHEKQALSCLLSPHN